MEPRPHERGNSSAREKRLDGRRGIENGLWGEGDGLFERTEVYHHFGGQERRQPAQGAACELHFGGRAQAPQDSLGGEEINQLALHEGARREPPRRVCEIEPLLFLIELKGRVEVVD